MVSSVALVVISLAIIPSLSSLTTEPMEGSLTLPHPELNSLIFAALVGLTVAYIVRRTGNARSAGWLLSLAMFVIVFQFSVDSGLFLSRTLWWLGLLPIMGAFVGGPRIAIANTVGALAMLTLFYLYEVYLASAPPGPEPDRSGLLASRSAFILFAGFLGWYYERLGSLATQHLELSNTQLQALNDDLRVSRMHMRTVTENIGQAVWLEDAPSRTTLYVNPSYAALYGRPPSELERDPDAWQRAVLEEDRARIPREPDGEEHLYRVVRSGVERWVRHTCIRAEGTNRRLLHIASDATLRRHEEALRTRFLEAVLKVQESERRHLARELHDETGQALTALLVGLRAIREGLDRRRQAHIDVLSTQLRQVVGDVSRLARGLHPSVLDELGLTSGIERLAQDAQAAHQIHVQVKASGRDLEDELSPEQRLASYRIVQEALTNVVRHARARRAQIHLVVRTDRVNLDVEDDGRGFDVEEVTGPSGGLGIGLGVHGMKERAQLLGGDVEIHSSPGKGTRVAAWFPRTTQPKP